MSTTELLAHEATITDFLVSSQEQGWREGAASSDRIYGFMERHNVADKFDLEAMSDEEFDVFFAA